MKNLRYGKIVYFIMILSLLLAITSCMVQSNLEQAENNEVFEEVPKNLQTPKITKIPTIPATPTIAPTRLEVTNLITATPLNPVASLTPTPNLSASTLTPTLAPIWAREHPFVSKDQATQILVDSLQDKSNCKLPCWWEIIPGETQIEAIEEMFVPRGFWWLPEYNELHDSSDAYKVSLYFVEEDGLIQSIEVKGGTAEKKWDQNEAWRNYSIPEILERYGRPDTVLVYHPYRFDRGVPPVYHLLMFYEDMGFEIDYIGSVEYLDDPNLVRACPNITETNVINLFLYQPEKIPNIVQHVFPRNSVSFTVPGEDIYDAISWEGATGMSLDDFYHLFTGAGESVPCFDFQTYWLQ